MMGYGYLDVNRAFGLGLLPAKVLLDDVDVSKDCTACDDIEGYVILKQGSAGRRVYEKRVGRVVFTPKQAV